MTKMKVRKNMTTIELINLLQKAKTQKEFVHILKTHRIPVNKSKYC